MKDNGVICMLPWLHFTVTMTDSIRPCCRFSQKSNVTIDNYYNEYEWLRKNMLDGVKTKECTRCYIEDQNSNSMRATANRNFNLKDVNNLTIEPLPLKFIEISLDNICNLECKMCNSLYSSKLLKRDIMLHDSNPNMFGNELQFMKPAKINNKTRFEKLKALDISWEHLTEIKLLGGEPFLSPQFKEFLIFFTSNVNPNNITLEIVTNCTKILQDDVILLLNKFKKIRLTGSIDGVYKYNDYQRVHSNFEDSVKNYKLYLKQLNNIYKPHIHITWSILNINCINKTVDFWENEKKNIPGLTISSTVAHGPTSPTHAPPWYHVWLDSIVNWNQDRMTKVTKQVINETSKFNNKNWKLIQKQIKLTDEFYKMFLKDYNPELHNFFKKYEKYDNFIEDVAEEKINLMEKFKVEHKEEVAELNLRNNLTVEANRKNIKEINFVHNQKLQNYIKKETIEKVIGKSLYNFYFDRNNEM